MNRVIICGRLGQDPEVRHTQSQKAVCNFSVATTEYSKDRDGERKEETEWHKVVVWDKMAENCGKYLSKGREVLVEGRLKTSSWEDQNGNRRYKTEIIATNVQFIGGQPQGYEKREDGVETRTRKGGGQKQDRRRDEAPPDDEDQGSAFGGPDTPGLDDIPF